MAMGTPALTLSLVRGAANSSGGPWLVLPRPGCSFSLNQLLVLHSKAPTAEPILLNVPSEKGTALKLCRSSQAAERISWWFCE